MKNNLSKINLSLLMTFDVLLKEKHVTRAAERLNLTQSAVSHSLRHLRSIFNDDLFIRGQASSMIPTNKALELAAPISEIIQSVNSILYDRSFDPKVDKYTFTLGMSDYSEFVLLPAIVRFLDKNAPNVNLVVKHLNFLRDSKVFENDTIDLAVGLYYDTPLELISRDIFTDRSVCVGWNKNPLLNNPICGKTFAQAKQILILYYEDRAKTPSEIYVKKLGFDRKVVATVSHTLAALYSLPNTDLICVAFERVVKQLIKNLPLKTQVFAIKECAKFSASLIWHPKNRNNAAHIWLRNSIIEIAKNI